MTLKKVKDGLLEKMQSIFPEEKYKYYTMAVIEGYDRPSFFTKLKPISVETHNYNTRRNHYAFYINYMQEITNESDALDKIQQLQELFGLGVRIGDRYIDVISFDYDFEGTNQNIPEIVIELEWFEKIKHETTAPLMEAAEITTKMEVKNNGNA